MAFVTATPAHAATKSLSDNVEGTCACWTHDNTTTTSVGQDIYFTPTNKISQVASQGIYSLNFRIVGTNYAQIPGSITGIWSTQWNQIKIWDNPSSGTVMRASACCWSASGGGDTYWAGTLQY